MTLPSIEELIGSTSQRLTPFRDYRMIRGAGESAYLSLFAPPQGQVLVTAATRVNHFDELTDTLPALGLPARMKDCLVYYACWQLLSQRLPIGQEELQLTQRQTESGTEDRSEILDGSQLQTQVEDKDGTQAQTRDSTTTDAIDKTVTTNEDGTTTEDKTPTITGTRESTTTELKAAVQQEDTNLEQTEDKNGTLSQASTESSSEARSGALTGSGTEASYEAVDSTLDSLTTDAHNETKGLHADSDLKKYVTQDETTVDSDGSNLSTADVGGGAGNVTQSWEPNQTTTNVYDHATPPHLMETITTGDQKTVDTHQRKDTQTQDTVTRHYGFAEDVGEDVSVETSHGDSAVHKADEQTQTTALSGGTTKAESSTEDVTGSVVVAKTDANAESNLLLNVQEKTATANEDNVTTFTETTTQGTAEDNVTVVDKTTIEVTDEDSTSIVAEITDLATTEDNTITTNQTTDNTTTSVFATSKVTGVESMQTYRDRAQTAQYYKMLFDLEVNAKKMRSWVARGL